MRLLIPPRRFDENVPEMVDRPDADPLLLEGELRNLRRINRYLGGVRAVRKALVPMVMAANPATTIEILDLATGSGDQPVAIARELRRRRRRVSITAVDNNDAVLADARAHALLYEEIRFERGDIRALPYADQSFDIVLCSLALHHFSWATAVSILRDMDRIARVGFILHDLVRSYLALAGAWAYTRATTTNIMTRTDAIASILAAFTEEELARMAEEAGVGRLSISREPMFRMNAVKHKL